jgi:hypothetical protein
MLLWPEFLRRINAPLVEDAAGAVGRDQSVTTGLADNFIVVAYLFTP